MAVRPVLRYPHPALKTPSEPAGSVSDAVRLLLDDLVETMRASPATVGLAAPQIGEAARVFVLDVSGHRRATVAHGLIELVDPEVLEGRGSDIVREGCLSVPDLTADVARPSRVVVRGRDRGGGERVFETEGFEARAILHELDHLDGLLILDRVSRSSDLFPRKVYR